MEKIVSAVLILAVVLGFVGCATKDESIGKTVFETENITSITFYGSAPNSTETKVPSEHLAEITQWLGTFVVAEKADDILPPGADSLFVRIEYSDGTVIDNSMSTTIVDGTKYLIEHSKEPEYYFELLADSAN